MDKRTRLEMYREIAKGLGWLFDESRFDATTKSAADAPITQDVPREIVDSEGRRLYVGRGKYFVRKFSALL
jgi:hypothetical protein